jgi:cytochrome oxidase Cu insertion factor (SCO1/SenC/PrrC family)
VPEPAVQVAGDEPAGPVDRAAAFSAGNKTVPHKFYYWMIAGLVALGLGGAALERGVSLLGINPKAAPTVPATRAGVAHRLIPPVPALPSTRTQVQAAVGALMGVTTLAGTGAPPIDLSRPDGARFALSTLRGRVVIVSFFDANCADICPVLAEELRNADADLGSKASDVAFITVNTDVFRLRGHLAPAPPILGSLTNWQFLSGSLSQLTRVWRSYGVTVEAAPATGKEIHTDVLYFIDSRGNLRFRASPFANETGSGVYRLPMAEIDRWARGIAGLATDLMRPGR